MINAGIFPIALNIQPLIFIIISYLLNELHSKELTMEQEIEGVKRGRISLQFLHSQHYKCNERGFENQSTFSSCNPM